VIGDLGLSTARKAVTLIPQEPFLLSGTIRSNVDPFGRYSDSEIIQVLKDTNVYESLLHTSREQKDEKKPEQPKEEKTKITKKVSEDEQLLDYGVAAGGSNLSVGQKQLVCIARALIAKPRILLMDEATAHIDNKTDQIVQEILQTKFNNSTILTIAHRLRTVIKYDRIMYIEEGRIGEYDDPYLLLQNKESKFYGLVEEGGPEFMEEMIQMAKEGYDDRNGRVSGF
jgi:ABC-type multidrug transport system fused ATPase/permease subunit